MRIGAIALPLKRNIQDEKGNQLHKVRAAMSIAVPIQGIQCTDVVIYPVLVSNFTLVLGVNLVKKPGLSGIFDHESCTTKELMNLLVAE